MVHPHNALFGLLQLIFYKKMIMIWKQRKNISVNASFMR